MSLDPVPLLKDIRTTATGLVTHSSSSLFEWPCTRAPANRVVSAPCARYGPWAAGLPRRPASPSL
ncbi:hypothetical protein BDW68DRAFT_171905 [Aspergillus falconensis]